MTSDRSFYDYVMGDLLRGVRGVNSRAMFGGWGIYKDGIIFAIIAEGELYFKADKSTREIFESLGSRPFSYLSKGKITELSYWLLPESVMENPGELAQWIDRSVLVSVKAAAKPKPVDKSQINRRKKIRYK